MQLSERIEALAAAQRPQYGDADRALFAEFRAALSRGTVRAAERLADGTWRVNAWVKRGILLGFRMGALVDMSPPHSPLRFFDKDTYPTRATTLAEGVRIVPGSPPAPSSRPRRRSTTWCASGCTGATVSGRSRFPRARSWCPAAGPPTAPPPGGGGSRSIRR